MLTLPQKVRDVMGLSDEAVANDRVIEELIRISQEFIKDALFIYHYDEEVNPNPYNGATWDGSNVTYQTKHYPIMDVTWDEQVNRDITCRWLSQEYGVYNGDYLVSSGTYGIVNLYQTGSTTAIPGDAESVRVDYYSCHRKVASNDLEDLATWFAAHLVEQLMTTGTSISMADFESNKKLLLMSPDRYLTVYMMKLGRLQGPSIRGV